MLNLERVGDLFREAIEREPGPERAAWLQEATGGDAELLAGVQRLLRAHAAVEAEGDPVAELGEGLAGGPALDLVRWARDQGGSRSGSHDDHRDWEPGPDDLVGRYRVVRTLGRGGMGAVFLGHDPVLDRYVALKLLPPELGDEPRLLDEARAASALDHPCIGTVYEVGEDAGGRSFIAMAYYEGGTLRERLREGPLPVDEGVRIAVQVADALDTAHRAGIVHRDVKPENLVFDASGRVKVVDFGIALAEREGPGSGSRGGTPGYMSPEELEGTPADGRSDLWALGVVLYEMLTGEHPFSGPDPKAVVDRIRVAEPPSATDVRPEIPSSLDAVLRHALAREPVDRVQTGQELARRLREAVEPAPAVTDLLRGPGRKPLLWGAAAILGVAFVAGIVVAWQAPRLVEAQGFAGGQFEPTGEAIVADFHAPEALAELALATREALVIDLQQSGFVRVAGRSRTAMFLERMGLPPDTPVQGNVALEVAERAGAGVVVEVTVARAGGRYVLAGRGLDPATAQELFSARVTAGERGLLNGVERLSREMRRQLGEASGSLAGSHPLPVVTTESLEALRLYAEAEKAYGNDPARAGRLLTEAVQIDPAFAMAHRLAAAAATGSLDFARVREHTQRAAEHRDRLTDQERWHIEAIHASEAEFDPWRAVDIYERILSRFPADFRAHWNLGNTRLGWLGDWEGAREAFLQALELNPSMGFFPITAGLTSLTLGYDEEAVALSGRAVEAGFHDHHDRFTMVYAFVHNDLEGMSEICTRLLGSGEPSPLPVDDREFCGSLYVGLERPELALDMLAEVFDAYREAGRFRNLAHVGQALAAAHLYLGDTAQARARLVATVEAIPAEGFPDPDRYLTRVNLATQAAFLGWTDLASDIRDRYPPHSDPDHWFGHAGEALVDAALALDRGDGARALAVLDAGFPAGVMPVGWRTFDELLRGRAHELLGNREAALEHYERAGSRRFGVKGFQTKDRMNMPLAREGWARVAGGVETSALPGESPVRGQLPAVPESVRELVGVRTVPYGEGHGAGDAPQLSGS